MMPSVLSKFGLREALEDIFDEIDDMGHIETKVLIEIDNVRLPENMEIMLYRIIQELANNTLKHANASKIIFSFVKKENIFEIDFIDNGIGFDPESLPHSKSLGIFGIRSRVDYLKGTIEMESSAGNGTKYHILIPR
jgi:signal transduction histidine kinase